MRIAITAVFLLGFALPATLSAEVVLGPSAPAAERPSVDRSAHPPAPLAAKARSNLLLVPFYEVDTSDPAGATTLFAVTNAGPSPVLVRFSYRTPHGQILHQEQLTLAARETLTRNLRDLSILPADPDGVARGYVVISQKTLQQSPALVGDYFQVDPGGDLATGQRLVHTLDYCDLVYVRFVDFGQGTELRLLLRNPQGSDPMSDPPSIRVRAYGENGQHLSTTNVYTDQPSLKLTASDFTSESFGNLSVSFLGETSGVVYAEYSAEGKFSVGLDGTCAFD